MWPKQSFVLAKGIETIFSCGSFYIFSLFEHGLLAGGTGEVLAVLVFTFILWDCLMEAQLMNVKLCSLDMMVKDVYS